MATGNPKANADPPSVATQNDTSPSSPPYRGK